MPKLSKDSTTFAKKNNFFCYFLVKETKFAAILTWMQSKRMQKTPKHKDPHKKKNDYFVMEETNKKHWKRRNDEKFLFKKKIILNLFGIGSFVF